MPNYKLYNVEFVFFVTKYVKSGQIRLSFGLFFLSKFFHTILLKVTFHSSVLGIYGLVVKKGGQRFRWYLIGVKIKYAFEASKNIKKIYILQDFSSAIVKHKITLYTNLWDITMSNKSNPDCDKISVHLCEYK